DSDLRSITPLWVKRLLGPIVEAQADYVAPLYARHKYDGTITNTIAYPLTRALYGMRIRQPIGGEFGFHADLARAYLAQPVWETDVARFGIDIFMTTTAVARKAKIAQAFLGAKIHDPKDPAADLGPMFTQVVGTLFRLAGENERVWRGVVGSRNATVIGEVSWVEPEAIPADPKKLREKYEALAPAQRQLWDDVLTAPVPSDMGPDGWARIVFDFLEAALRHPKDSEALARGLLPLYYARVAEFFTEIKDMDTQRSEDIVEVMAKAMEIEKMERLEAVDEGADVAT
ncbi:MAG TPA: cell wall biosynthesis glycosyltransferase, partial [Candidatus Acidoferrales bacterium]|nr:cell wall biosynthesis glycosyltransferase [Candidatus Acidoferrales bacterium]